MKTVGLDGKLYDDINEAIGANARYKQQQKQNELLKKQNDLLEEIANNDKKNKEMQDELENEKIKMQNDLEHEKLKMQLELQNNEFAHKKALRILSLFDEIGISKPQFDKFEEYLFCKRDVNKLKDNIEKINVKKSNLDSILYHIEQISSTSQLKHDYHYYDYIDGLQDTLNEIVDNCASQKSKKELSNLITNHSLEEAIEKVKQIEPKSNAINLYNNYINLGKTLKITTIIILISIFLFGISLLFMGGENVSSFIILISIMSLLGIFICSIVLLGSYISRKNMPKNIFNELENGLSTANYFGVTDESLEKSIKNMSKKLKLQINDMSKEIDKINEQIKEQVLLKWQKFLEFRLNHYNVKIENLLLDVELDKKIEKYGITYEKVTKNKKISDSSIEDYINYFDNI